MCVGGICSSSLSYHRNDTESRVNYCIAVGKHTIRITERRGRGCSSKDSLCSLSVSPLSTVTASSVTMATQSMPPCFVSASFPLFPFSFANCRPAQQVESFLSFFQNGEKQNDTSLVCRSPFSIQHQTTSLVLFLCFWPF